MNPPVIQIRVLNHTRRALKMRQRVEGAVVTLEIEDSDVRTEGGIIVPPQRDLYTDPDLPV